jgi:hypothetical protein
VRAASVATALALAACLLVGAARAGDSPVPYPPRVTLITDSVGGILSALPKQRTDLGKGLDLDLEAWACRKLADDGCTADAGTGPSVLATVQQLGSQVGYVLVVDVGYNDFSSGYGEHLDEVIRAALAAGVQKVVWVTLHESEGTWREINAQIRAAAGRWPQLTVADWASVADASPAWFVDDAHMTDAGATAFAAFLRPVILQACGAPCVPPLAVATLGKATVRAHRATLRWKGDDHARSFDVQTRRGHGSWRIAAKATTSSSTVVRGTPGWVMQARVRARNEDDTPGAWAVSPPFRL